MPKEERILSTRKDKANTNHHHQDQPQQKYYLCACADDREMGNTKKKIFMENNLKKERKKGNYIPHAQLFYQESTKHSKFQKPILSYKYKPVIRKERRNQCRHSASLQFSLVKPADYKKVS